MNAVQQQAIREILEEEGCANLEEWLEQHGDDIPQVGICSVCGDHDNDCDPDTVGEYCSACAETGHYSSILVVLGMI